MIYLIFQGVMFSLWTVQSPLFAKMIIASVEEVRAFALQRGSTAQARTDVHMTTVGWFRAQYHGLSLTVNLDQLNYCSKLNGITFP